MGAILLHPLVPSAIGMGCQYPPKALWRHFQRGLLSAFSNSKPDSLPPLAFCHPTSSLTWLPRICFCGFLGTTAPACGSTLPLLAQFPVISWACMAGWLPCRTVGNGWGGGGAVASVLGVLGWPRKALPAFRPRNCQPAGESASRSKILRCPARRSFPSLSKLKLRLSQWALHKQPVPAAFTTMPWAGQFLARLSVSCAGHTERTALTH